MYCIFMCFCLTISSHIAIIMMHKTDAGLAHLVERHLAKVEVASSNLVTRSNPLVTSHNL